MKGITMFEGIPELNPPLKQDPSLASAAGELVIMIYKFQYHN
jgi:hypothetical protein